MKMQIGPDGPLYDIVDIEKLTLYECLLLEQQTAEVGRPMLLSEIEQLQPRILACPAAERVMHPDMGMYMAVQIWAARRRGGEKVTFAEALDFPRDEMRLILDPDEVRKPDPRKPRARGAASGNRPKPGKKGSTKRSTRA